MAVFMLSLIWYTKLSYDAKQRQKGEAAAASSEAPGAAPADAATEKTPLQKTKV